MIGWFLAVCLFILLVAVLVAAYDQIDKLRTSVDNERSDHLACHEATEQLLRTASIRTDQQALMAAADAWDSIDERPNRDRLVRAYVEGGPSVPAMWLRDRAAKTFAEVSGNEVRR